jgi:hypothetical protein
MRTGVKKRGYMGALQGILRALELARIPVRTVRSPDERLRRYKQVDKKLRVLSNTSTLIAMAFLIFWEC